MGAQQNNAKWAVTQILLIAQVLVDRHKRIEVSADSVEQRTVIKIRGPQERACGGHSMLRNKCGETLRHAGIEYNAHAKLRGADDGLPQQCLASELQHGNRMFSRDSRKVRQEFGERMSAFDVINQDPHRYTRASKARLAAETVRTG